MSSVAGTTYSFYVHRTVPTLVPPRTSHLFSVTSPQALNLGTGSQITAEGCSGTGTRSAIRGLWSLAQPVEEQASSSPQECQPEAASLPWGH